MAKLGKQVDAIDVEPRHLKMVRAILAKHLPGKEVWAYGSRVKWNATERSDLDCVVFDATDAEIDTAREVFTESEIPFEVQVFGWQNLPDEFKANIEKQAYVLQHAKAMGDWQEKSITEIAQIISGGTPKTDNAAYWNGDIPWLSVADFNNELRWVDKAEKSITELGLSNSATKVLEVGDIIISARGTVGALAQVAKPMAFNQSCYGLRANPEISDQGFFYYSLKSGISQILQSTHGSVFDTITKVTFDNLFVNLPPLPEQQAIAEVLSSLDDKIDLLHRQNQTLEALAETLFRQWFIEEADPEWEERPLSFFGQIICGKTPSKTKAEYFGGNTPFIKIPDMHNKIYVDTTTDSLSEIGKASQLNKTIPQGSICVSCIATVGLVSIAIKESQTNQQINSIIPNNDMVRYYLYFCMKQLKGELEAMASGGTATPNLNTGDFSRIPILLPEESLLKLFHEKSFSVFEKIKVNFKQIQKLEKTRDELLPKLMSGEVRVSIEEVEAQ
jgi:type I restriction enzyme S subunit